MSSVFDFSLTAVFATTLVPLDDCAGGLLGSSLAGGEEVSVIVSRCSRV